MSDLTPFQKTLMENLIEREEALRHGHSEAVLDLIDKGYIVKEDGVFIATEEAKELME